MPHWKDPDAGKDWRQEEKGMAGWDGWVTSPTWWTWRHDVLQSMGSQRVGHDRGTELTDASCSSERSKEIMISVGLSLAVRSLLLVLTWIVSVEWYGQKPSCHTQSVCGGRWKDYFQCRLPLSNLERGRCRQAFFLSFFLNIGREKANGDEVLKTEKKMEVLAVAPNNV